MLKYDANFYDENLNLKVTPLLWFSILYGIRHFFFVAAAKLMPMDVVTVPWLNLQASEYFLLADVPALLVLIAIGHRTPDGLKPMQWVWRNGRILLVASYASSLAAFIFINNIAAEFVYWDVAYLAPIVLIDVFFIAYLLRSELVRDIFGNESC